MSSNEPPVSSKSIHVSDLKEWSLALRSHQRPLLVHLNGDTTWLLQLPYPLGVTPPRGRSRYNILLDPWLQGPQSDVAWWFSTQWHVVPPSVATIADLNAALRTVEGGGCDGADLSGSLIDAVIVSHEYTDHCHRATLEELPSDTLVFAADPAAKLIPKLAIFPKRFDNADPGERRDGIHLHSAIVIAFDIGQFRANAPRLRDSPGEVIIYSPHGIESKDLEGIQASNLQTLALLHGLHDVRVWMAKQLNLGALNGIRSVAVTGAKYWLATHDEVKTAKGLISLFLRRTSHTMDCLLLSHYEGSGTKNEKKLEALSLNSVESSQDLTQTT